MKRKILLTLQAGLEQRFVLADRVRYSCCGSSTTHAAETVIFGQRMNEGTQQYRFLRTR